MHHDGLVQGGFRAGGTSSERYSERRRKGRKARRRARQAPAGGRRHRAMARCARRAHTLARPPGAHVTAGDAASERWQLAPTGPMREALRGLGDAGRRASVWGLSNINSNVRKESPGDDDDAARAAPARCCAHVGGDTCHPHVTILQPLLLSSPLIAPSLCCGSRARAHPLPTSPRSPLFAAPLPQSRSP